MKLISLLSVIPLSDSSGGGGIDFRPTSVKKLDEIAAGGTPLPNVPDTITRLNEAIGLDLITKVFIPVSDHLDKLLNTIQMHCGNNTKTCTITPSNAKTASTKITLRFNITTVATANTSAATVDTSLIRAKTEIDSQRIQRQSYCGFTRQHWEHDSISLRRLPADSHNASK